MLSLPAVCCCGRCRTSPTPPSASGSSLRRSSAGSACEWMYLDSKPEFAAALALYRRRGYVECPRYNDNAQATVFLSKSLASA